MIGGTAEMVMFLALMKRALASVTQGDATGSVQFCGSRVIVKDSEH